MLVASDGRSTPRKVRITFTPASATLEREYDPAIAFSNGAAALYSDQFDLAPINDLLHPLDGLLHRQQIQITTKKCDTLRC